MKRIVVLIVHIVLCLGALQSQTTLKDLEKQRANLQKEIQASESMLSTTNRSVSSQLKNLSLINQQIEERKTLIRLMTRELAGINRNVNTLNKQITQLENDLKDKRKKYDASVQYLQKNRSIQDKLLFIFSAESLNQMYRRLRYVREYATYQRLQGEEIQDKQTKLRKKRVELKQTQQKQQKLLKEQERNQSSLQSKEKQQRQLVAGLQKQQKVLQSELDKKRQEARRLNARIDAEINAEIERSRRNATANDRAVADRKSAAPMSGFTMSKADRELSGSFSGNRGKLPMPVSGAFSIVSHFGQYNVEGLKNVKLDNKGIDIQAKPGANARAIFNGEVSAVFQFQGNGLYNILIRHGNYISVYCNLSSTAVKPGERVKTGQTLGRIFSDKRDGDRTVLHFQLRKEREQLNPEQWLDH